MSKYRSDLKLSRGLARLLTDTAIVNVSSYCMKEFIRQLARIEWDGEANLDYVNTILDSMMAMQHDTAHREIFVFNGESQSGISLVPLRQLPKDGYCFFGWIRLERRDQSSQETTEGPMCIYKLGTGSGHEVELGLQDGVFYYTVSRVESCCRSRKGRGRTSVPRPGFQGTGCAKTSGATWSSTT
jgi:hypothetical protein